jgi:ribose transport system substrate-binding protein
VPRRGYDAVVTLCRHAVVALLAAALCGAPACKRQAGPRGITLAVIPQGSTHEFWKSIHAGAVKASRDLAKEGSAVTIIWKGPLREDDREQQTQVVEGFISQGVQGIVLAPFDSHALVRPVEEAARARIPTVVIDSGLQTEQIVSFVATDNEKGGALAADRMAELLHDQGKVLLLRYQEGSASTEARERGFVQHLKQGHPGITLISSNQYAGPTRDTAKRASENLLTRHGGEVQGIFTPNESSTAGMLLALQDSQKAGHVSFVGFDTSDTFVEAMRAGQLHGLVVQDPFRMGELGVRTMVDHLRGKPVERRVDTGATMVTPENMNQPEVQRLLHPPLAQYLGG